MKRNYIIFLTLFIVSSILNLSIAKEAEVILIEAEIYNLKESQKLHDLNAQLEEAVLEESPRLLMEVGKDATIEIGIQDSEGKDIDMIRLYINSNDKEDSYDLDFQLISKGEKSISRIEDTSLNSTLAVSASINDSVKVAKIRTTKFKNKKLGMAALKDL